MRDSYSIQEIGEAISKISNVESREDSISLSPKASVLADCYGAMIYLHRERVPASELSEEQLSILSEVFPHTSNGSYREPI